MTQQISDRHREASEAILAATGSFGLLRHFTSRNDKFPLVFFVLCVALFAVAGLLTLLWAPFPSAYDELQHLSFINALRDTPALFPHYGTYRVLGADLHSWSGAPNYLAHPPLYYFLLAPFGDHVVLLRAINLAMASTGFMLCAVAGMRILSTNAQRYAFLLLLLAFSKPALIAGMINNDNLVLLETGLLFWFLARPVQISYALESGHPGAGGSKPTGLDLDSRVHSDSRYQSATWTQSAAIALLLALVGWTKFNAFVGLTLWVGLLHAFKIARREERFIGRASVLLLAGMLGGFVPALANLATIGTIAYVPTDFLFVDPASRLSYDFAQFLAAFVHKIGLKIFLVDGVVDLMPAVGILTIIGAFAVSARVSRRTADVAVAAWAATLLFAVVHVFYGWNSFRTLGSMSDAQSRYYVMLWPGFALATVLGGSALVRRSDATQSSDDPAGTGLLHRSAKTVPVSPRSLQ